jgi:predicted ATPase/class 3 adenylate cyclase
VAVELPSGTVTFLFTDIEDSTRRWEQDLAAMSAALARHDDLLLAAVSANRGAVFAKSGDGMAVVFGRAGDAIAAAVAAQRAFEIEPWSLALRVRMGVHTGEAEERGGDYFGPAVNRAARLMSEAIGGQVLVSLSATEVVRDRLSEDVKLVELGERTLRSLSRPERVFELIWSAEREALPEPPAARPSPPAGAPSTLFGRDAELADITDMVGSERLVTLVGPGGVGKTTLAMETARRHRTGRETAVVTLTSVTDPTALADVLAGALGLRGNIGDPLQAAMALLGSRPWLVVIDNCEHLLPAVREMVATLSNGCDKLTILATSRERLGLPFEQVYRVAPLLLPASDQLDDLAGVPSVALFVDRARRVRPGFGSDDGQAAAVATLVRRLDGMPLAIELAAGRLSSLSLADLDRRLDRALDVLAAGGHVDQHHGTLRTAIGWSYNLLPDDEQRLFRALSVFPDGFDLATAEAVASEVAPAVDPTTAVAHLVDASMLVATFTDVARYRMLDTLRAYGLDQLASTNELDLATDRLLRWAVRLVGWIDRAVVTEDEPSAAACLVAEVGNLRAVWHTARSTDNFDVAAALVVSLWNPLDWRDLSELWNWAPELAADPRILDHPSAVCVMAAASSAMIARGQLAEGEVLARRGLELAGDGDSEGRWRCGIELATLDLYEGRLVEAIAHWASLAVPGWEAVTLDSAAMCAAYAGKLDDARRFNDRARSTASSPSIRAYNRYLTAEIDNLAGDWASAQQHYRESIALAETVGTAIIQGIASVGLVAVQAASGQVREALGGYRDLIDHWQRIGAWTQQWTTLRNAADLFDQLGDHDLASFLRDAADRAPEASVAGATTGRPQADDADSRPPMARGDAHTREEVLDIAREAIAQWLAAVAIAP